MPADWFQESIGNGADVGSQAALTLSALMGLTVAICNGLRDVDPVEFGLLGCQLSGLDTAYCWGPLPSGRSPPTFGKAAVKLADD